MTQLTMPTTCTHTHPLPDPPAELLDLIVLLSGPEIIPPQVPSYLAESQTWSIGKNLHPHLIIRPKSVESLARAIQFLAKSSLNFNIYNSGAGDASAKDVLVSTRALTSFEFDREKEIVTIGAGSLWSEYHEQMRRAGPDYAVVAAATPFIGVGGSILAAGFSLMSKEFGCISDPENLLDAEVVKLDGSVVWASSEPDLLWGLRGAHLGLGVVTKLKLRARKYPRDIWGGPIVIPRAKEQEVARAISNMDKSDSVNRRVFALLLLMPDIIVVNAFDAMGEEHGRQTFAPLLSIEGAMDNTHITDLAGFAAMQAPAEAGKGKKHVWFNPLALGQLSEELLLRSFEWQRRKASEGADANIMYELWGVRGSSSGPTASAWPRSDKSRHFCMLTMGAPPSASAQEIDRARRVIQEGPTDIMGEAFDETLTAASALDDYHNIEKIYEQNWDRILAVKRKYDPALKLQGSPLARACARRLNGESPPIE